MNIFSIFLTGVFAGGLTCLAVQGGLLASSLAQQEEKALAEEGEKTDHVLPILSFLVARLCAYTALGILLGTLGSVVQLSLNARVFLQCVVVIFMIGTALNLLHVHPIFRYFVIQPPKFLTRLVKKQSKSTSMFGPMLLGAFTVLIPCGATQAMMAYATTTGSWLSGGVTMFAFILGTSPMFFLLGYVSKKLGAATSTYFNGIAAVAIIIIALYNFNSALSLAGSTLTFENIFFHSQQAKGDPTQTVTQAKIYFTQSGYTTEPSAITVRGGEAIKLTLINQHGAGCIQAFTIPMFGIQKTVPVGTTSEVSFTAPKVSGTIPFMCGMGMFKGVINVI
jgi:sulfite exporter TauE/SafE